jgi:DNA repair protein RecO (recombination protein O)
MALIETESLVLKSYNLAEADKIVVLLTRDHGVVRGVAKGVKRLKSRFGSGLEPFSQVNVTYFEKDAVELVSIQKAEIVQSNFTAASDPDFLQKFSFLGDLLISFMPPHDPNEKLFRMAKACVDAAVVDATNLAAIGLYFEIWLLRLSGYLPDWSQCDRCKRTFTDDEQTSIQSDFHLQCSACSRAGRRILDAPTRAFVASVLSVPPAKFAEQTTGRLEHLNELSAIIRPLTARSLGREVVGEKSLSIGL